MIQYMPPLIMFLATVALSALFVVPMKRWTPKSGTVRFYWRGVWMFLVAISAISGGMNTLLLMGIDVVDVTQTFLNLLLPAFVGFVVLGWFHLVGLGLLTTGRKLGSTKN